MPEKCLTELYERGGGGGENKPWPALLAAILRFRDAAYPAAKDL